MPSILSQRQSRDPAISRSGAEIVEIEKLLQGQSWDEAKRKLADCVSRLDLLRGRKTFP